MNGSAVFASLMEEHGSHGSQTGTAERKGATDRNTGGGVKGMDDNLMQNEERNVGYI